MKTLQTAVTLLMLISVSAHTYSQLWKQYSDSAKIYNDQKNTDKAIELYSKAKEELKKDSVLTNTYAQICDSLANIYVSKGKYAKSEPLYLEAKQIREKVFGKENVDYAASCDNLGRLYINMGKYEKAEPLILEAKQIREKVFGKENVDYAASCDNLGRLYISMGKYEKAESLILEAKQIKEKILGKANVDYAASCDNLGRLYINMGKYEKAEPLILEAKQIKEKILGKENADYATSCNNLGRLYTSMDKYEKAEPLILEAKEIREKTVGKEHPDYAASCNDLGYLYQLMSKFEKAEPLLLDGKEIREKTVGKDHPDYATSCNCLAVLYRQLGQYEKAEPLALEAKEIREKVLGKQHANYAGSCISLGNLYYEMGQYQKTELLYLEARQVQEKVLGKKHRDYAQSCVNLAGLYSDMGQYEKAEALYLESKQITEVALGKKHQDYALSCNNLADFYRSVGRYEKAESLALEARQIWEKVPGKKHPFYAANCTNLGTLYYEMGQYKKAELFFLEARYIIEKLFGKAHPMYAQNCSNLAVIYDELMYYKKAKLLYIEAKQVQAKTPGKESPEYATSCDNLAILYTKIGQYEKAEPLFLEGKQIREKVLGKEHSDYAISCDNLACLYRDIGQTKKAELLYLEARQIWRNAFGKEHSFYLEGCLNLGNLYWILKSPQKANDAYTEALQSQNIQVSKVFQFTSETEKQSYINKFGDLENCFLSFSTSVYRHFDQGFSYNVSLSHRNLILSSSQQLRNTIYNTSDTSLKNKYNAWIDLREQLSFWYTKPVAERPDYIKDLEDQANTLEKELTRLSITFRNEQEQNNITWKDIQQHLKPNEAAIEFVKFNFYNGKRFTDSIYYVAMLLTKDRAEPELIRLFEERQLKNYKTVTSLYGAKQKFNVPYHLIWEPIEKHLNGIQKIYFAPAGVLYRISFPALRVNDHQVLSHKYQLVQLNTTASVVNQLENFIDTSDKISLYGGIKYDVDSATLKQAVATYHSSNENVRSLPDDSTRGGSWTYLPGTEKEIDEINSLGKQKNYAVVSSEGVSATEESVKALTGRSSPSVLHIATHGFFFSDPKENKKHTVSEFESGSVFRQSDNPLFRSGLLMAGANNAWHGKQIEGVEDGILTAYEVSNLYLPNTRLVVLSACETGLGDIEGNEGVYGLQRAFKMAGAENLIMSLWKVPDKEAAEFMEEFYKNIFDKQSVEEAFYKAQTVLRNKYRPEPKKWAAWVLVR